MTSPGHTMLLASPPYWTSIWSARMTVTAMVMMRLTEILALVPPQEQLLHDDTEQADHERLRRTAG